VTLRPLVLRRGPARGERPDCPGVDFSPGATMARRQPTAEQKRKAAERRERFTVLAKQVAAMGEDERAALVFRMGAIATVDGRALSVFNSCLVLTQLPDAALVGGFLQWKEHGRSVRKGAVGLMIWIPTKGKADGPKTGDDLATDESGTDGPRRAGFVMGTVFDVTQTEERKPQSVPCGSDFGGAFDGFTVTSVADPVL